jgi:hypothetical protein
MVPIRRVTAILILALAVATMLFVFYKLLSAQPTTAFNFDGSMRGDKGVVAIEPDPRVRWEHFEVGNFALCKRDSCIRLPVGSVLSVPFIVRDSLFDTD